MDTGRLIALLNLTTSDNDNEALSAIRHANAMLKKNGKSWVNVIGLTHATSVPPKRPTTPPPTYRNTTWTGGLAPKTFEKEFVLGAFGSTYFNEYLVKKDGNSKKWAGILHTYFMKWGTLSEKQYKIFEEIWNDFIKERV